MSARLKLLKQRRELLVSQSTAQRSEVAVITQTMQRRLQFVDTGLAIVKSIRSNPGLATASATLFLPEPHNKLLLWGGRLFIAWELVTLARNQWRDYKENKERE